jgi:hypothetical protein
MFFALCFLVKTALAHSVAPPAEISKSNGSMIVLWMQNFTDENGRLGMMCLKHAGLQAIGIFWMDKSA